MSDLVSDYLHWPVYSLHLLELVALLVEVMYLGQGEFGLLKKPCQQKQCFDRNP